MEPHGDLNGHGAWRISAGCPQVINQDFNKKDALIIGDSLNTDIKGGLLSGIDTC
ncbi:HAD hydrolase-like protein [Paenibacillus glycanilyticus]|uniref:HAD hydrolase-like protein n=1 Tax=Paenibacillus glycanilyticus TaxID=126569 RepID=UPI002559F6BA|nr:HAD hydrolase-like protein [Paenibacillus glycanilyticus]